MLLLDVDGADFGGRAVALAEEVLDRVPVSGAVGVKQSPPVARAAAVGPDERLGAFSESAARVLYRLVVVPISTVFAVVAAAADPLRLFVPLGVEPRDFSLELLDSALCLLDLLRLLLE